MKSQDRYDGKPMLRFVDSYVLDAIGMLDDVTRGQLEALAPELSVLLGVQPGSWQSIVEESMHFPVNTKSQIQQLWQSCQKQAGEDAARLNPVEFAHFVADTQIGGVDIPE